MFWDHVAGLYDVFVNVINGKAHRALRGIVAEQISSNDKVLECACGTGLLSAAIAPKCKSLVATDFSEQMLKRAAKNCAAYRNITFQPADITTLSFPDNAFDAFPDKEAAYREAFRVLKKGGVFCGCFYIQGGCARTDWFIKHLYQPKGFFTAPYETEDSLRARLTGMYDRAEVSSVEGIACFKCVK